MVVKSGMMALLIKEVGKTTNYTDMVCISRITGQLMKASTKKAKSTDMVVKPGMMAQLIKAGGKMTIYTDMAFISRIMGQLMKAIT